MTAQQAPHTPPLWRRFLSLPQTGIGWWAVGLLAVSVPYYLWLIIFLGGRYAVSSLALILAIMLLVVPLASGLVGSLALGAGERSLLVWFAQVPAALFFFGLLNVFREGSPWVRGSVGVLLWAVIAFGIGYLNRSTERTNVRWFE